MNVTSLNKESKYYEIKLNAKWKYYEMKVDANWKHLLELFNQQRSNHLTNKTEIKNLLLCYNMLQWISLWHLGRNNVNDCRTNQYNIHDIGLHYL